MNFTGEKGRGNTEYDSRKRDGLGMSIYSVGLSQAAGQRAKSGEVCLPLEED